MKKKVIIGGFIYIIVMLFAISIMLFLFEDREPPVITIEDSDITYQEGDNRDVLLQGVKAVDKVEGDVSGSLTIESVRVLSDGDKISVMYAARDSKNNVTKKERILNYRKDESDDREGSGDTGEAADSSEINDDQYSAVTSPEGENNSQDTVNNPGDENDWQDTAEGETTDNQGTEDQTEESVEEAPLVSTGDPVIKLNTYEVTIEAGGYFNPMNYIQDAVDDVDDAWRRIRIVGNYNINTPGEYTLEYSITDSDGNRSNVEELILTVE